jgi:hypothetical protein
MPAWSRVWNAFCRRVAGDDATVAAGPGTDRVGSVCWRGALYILRAGGRHWRRLCAPGREWIREVQRERERAQEAIQNKDHAKRRALSLLLSLLNPEQRQEFQTYGHFHVIGGTSGNRYRIRVDLIANIDVLRHDGTVKHRLCAHPTGDIPMFDVMAGQLLYLQDPITETRFLAQANCHPARLEDQVRRAPTWMSSGGPNQ